MNTFAELAHQIAAIITTLILLIASFLVHAITPLIQNSQTTAPYTVIAPFHPKDTEPVEQENSPSEKIPNESASTTSSTHKQTPPQSTVEELKTVAITNIRTAATKAAVNIVCITQTATSTRTISGSGMIVNPQGVIVTNAHVAAYILLAEYGSYQGDTSCRIRTESPSHDTYIARPIYVSPTWLRDNPFTAFEENPSSTGEHDIAFLLITGTVDGLPLPLQFPFIPFDASETLHTEGNTVLIAAYPGELFANLLPNNGLWLLTPTSTIINLYTFKNPKTIDLISLKGSIASQHGSSGGGVIDTATKKILGIVVTTGEGTTVDVRPLNAITVGHIDDTVRMDTGMSLSAFLADPHARLTSFSVDTNYQFLNTHPR